MGEHRASELRDDVPAAVSFGELYDAHVDEVYRFVHRRCRDHALTEDITQETFVTAIRRVDDPTTISVGWLVTVARNRLVDALRKHARHERKLHLLGTGLDDEHDPDLAERLRVGEAMNELSVDHRLVLTLHYLDGLTVPALAEELGRSVKSVEGLITRARRELRAKLDESADAPERGERHG
jgi:RNA polymerase sigma-70 factor (ECF subfamily)